MSTKYKGKYIGPKKIKSVKVADRKTYFGNKVFEIQFTSGKAEYPEKVLKEIVTEEESDLTSLRKIRVKPVTQEIIGVLTESELSWEDIQYLLNTTLPFSLNDSFNRAYKKFWGKIKEKVTLKDLDDKLKDKNGASSE